MNPLLLCLMQIVRPVDHAALAQGPFEVIAKAPEGSRLELDGQALAAQTPFPGVLTAKVNAAPGRHVLTLVAANERQQIEVAVGPLAGFTSYRAHPPATAVACTTCHGVSARGRFRFEGGCFNCHAAAVFQKTHTHDQNKLAECGVCHNAHGSIVKAHLIRPRETTCKVCHE